MAGRRRGRGGGDAMGSICSVLALILILVACVELCGAATVVDVYRLIQYNLVGAPFGSRATGLSHRAGALPFGVVADLSCTVAMIPVRELNLTFLQDYIASKNPLGELLLLLPHKLGESRNGAGVGLLRSTLTDLERLLIHTNIPVQDGCAFTRT